MKPYGWLTITPVGRADDGLTVLCDVKVKRWHPGFWLFVVKSILHPNATATAKDQ